MITEELQAPGVVGGDQLCQEQASKQPREHADREEEAGPAGDPPLAVERDAAARHDDVGVRVMGERRAQVWSTAVRPMRAPRCLGSAAMVMSVSAAALNRMS